VSVKRKLIEVALPLEVINRESAREKSIRHGHPSTLHLWWARRPLAACRAVLFASLVDDPSSYPDRFPTEADQERERQRLFALLERLVPWEATAQPEVLEAAHAEIVASCDGAPPPVLDPFAGGGSIPLEAQRLGLEVRASDLNPVSVLITKALVELPPRFAGRPPVHPDAGDLGTGGWTGARGLAEDVRRYGAWMREEARQRIGDLYPDATLPNGSAAAVIAWLWARTVKCPNPACGATMPLVSTYKLATKKGKERWVRPVVDPAAKRVRFTVSTTEPSEEVPKQGRGARFRCLVCGQVAPEEHVKAEGMAGRMGQELMATVADGGRSRVYLDPSERDERANGRVESAGGPAQEMPTNPRWFSPPAYGLNTYEDLFTQRQLLGLTTLAELVGDARERVLAEGAYADAVATYLARLSSPGPRSPGRWRARPKPRASRRWPSSHDGPNQRPACPADARAPRQRPRAVRRRAADAELRRRLAAGGQQRRAAGSAQRQVRRPFPARGDDPPVARRGLWRHARPQRAKLGLRAARRAQSLGAQRSVLL